MTGASGLRVLISCSCSSVGSPDDTHCHVSLVFWHTAACDHPYGYDHDYGGPSSDDQQCLLTNHDREPETGCTVMCQAD